MGGECVAGVYGYSVQLTQSAGELAGFVPITCDAVHGVVARSMRNVQPVVSGYGSTHSDFVAAGVAGCTQLIF